MRITWLLENADRLTGGVKVALEDANWLAARGHQVTVASRTRPPSWMDLRCSFERVEDFAPENLPPADVRIGVSWETLPALGDNAEQAAAVYLCHCYEGEMAEHAADAAAIDAAYRTPGVQFVTVSPHLDQLLGERFGIHSQQITHAVDHQVHYPGPLREPQGRIRVGLVGSMQVTGKDIATGLQACRLAHEAGLQLELVRISNDSQESDAHEMPFPVEFHRRVPPARMGDLYRSMDVFLGTSDGPAEGFSLPAAEALACGVPCVLTEAPSQQPHGRNQFALFVPARDPISMAEALVVAGRAPEIRMALRKAGIAAAARYTQGSHGRQLEQVLKDACERQRQQTMRRLQSVQSKALELHERQTSPALDAPANATAVIAEPARQQSDQPETVPFQAPVFGITTGRQMPETGESTQQSTERMAHALRQMAEQLRGAREFLAAAKYYNAAFSLWPEVPALASEAAFCRHLAGDTLGGLQSLKTLVDAGVDDVAVHERRGLLLHACGQANEAVQAFRNAIEAGGRSADAYNNLGVVLFQSGDTDGARSNFLRALAIDPAHADAKANLEDISAA